MHACMHDTLNSEFRHASYDSCCAHKAFLYMKDDTVKVEFIKDKAVSLLGKFTKAKATKAAAGASAAAN